MKYLGILFGVCFFLRIVAQDTLTPIKSFGKNPGDLKMFYYSPFTKKDTSRKPLVVVLHGCGQTANAVADLTGWNKLSKENNFYVLYPEQRFLNNSSNCFNWFLKRDIERGRGEAASIYSMIKYMSRNFNVDSNQVYITGLSAGAGLTIVLMATYPELFKAGAEFAGGPYKAAENVLQSVSVMAGKVKKSSIEWKALVNEQNPNYLGTYPKLIIYQGENDPIVNKKNAKELILQWSAVLGIDTIIDKKIKNYKEVKDIERIVYTDKIGREKIIYYKVNNMGHQLLIEPGNEINKGGKFGIFSAEKKYHSTYYTAKDFGLIR